ncbi:unnamed protein product [Cutaneotrichosporon oleaginosum]
MSDAPNPYLVYAYALTKYPHRSETIDRRFLRQRTEAICAKMKEAEKKRENPFDAVRRQVEAVGGKPMPDSNPYVVYADMLTKFPDHADEITDEFMRQRTEIILRKIQAANARQPSPFDEVRRMVIPENEQALAQWDATIHRLSNGLLPSPAPPPSASAPSTPSALPEPPPPKPTEPAQPGARFHILPLRRHLPPIQLDPRFSVHFDVETSLPNFLPATC